jgi:hypothetical protein
MRYAIRRTQKDAEAEAKQKTLALPDDYRTLQQLAIARGIPGNQSAEALKKALSK